MKTVDSARPATQPTKPTTPATANTKEATRNREHLEGASTYSNSRSPSFNWPVVALLFFMCGVPGLPAVYFIAQLLIGPPAGGGGMVASHYFENVMPILIHAASGFVFFLTVPWQFSPKLRKRYPNWHRTSGKFAIIAAYVLALSGIWVICFVSIEPSLPKLTGFIAVSLTMIFSFTMALRAIIKRRIAVHRAWMMRGVAIPLGAVTPLLMSTPIIAAYGNLDSFMPSLAQLESDYNRWFGMIFNLAVVEGILLKERWVKTRSARQQASSSSFGNLEESQCMN